jgi:hypothetical protein
MVLDKFNGRLINARVWIETFEMESERLDVTTDRYCEAICLFLEGPVAEWYSATRKIIGTSNWETWKKSFLDTFADKGWSEVNLAVNFRHVKGPISEYALKKLNLLLDADPELTERSRVNLIVVGLPPFIQSRLNRKEVTSFSRLMSELNQLNTATNKVNSTTRNDKISGYTRNSDRKSCSICEKKRFSRQVTLDGNVFF